MDNQQNLINNLNNLSKKATTQPGPPPSSSIVDSFKSAPGLSAGISNKPMSAGHVDFLNQQVKTSSAAMNAIAQRPGLSASIGNITAGGQQTSGALGTIGKAIFDNPISKTILGAGSVVDTGRRAIISGIREVADVLDNDSRTKGSLKDWFSQTKDTSYGFGKAFPMTGWSGRLLGLIGDIGLDPLTYASLGATVPEALVLRGAQEAELALKGLEVGSDAYKAVQAEQTLRSALGVKHIAGKEGRVALAGLVDRMGGSAELVKDVASKGRVAFRTSEEGIAMADKVGLQRSGVYFFGSRVRAPMSGPIADALESGLTRTRMGIMGSSPMAWLAENMALTGTSSKRVLKEINTALATGNYDLKSLSKVLPNAMGDAEKAQFFVRVLGAENYARAQTKIVLDEYMKRIAPILENEDIRAAGPTVYQFLDTPQYTLEGKPNWARPMTDVETRAYGQLKSAFNDFHNEVGARMRLVDPKFVMGDIQDYFPHMMTKDASEWLGRKSSGTRAEEIMQYLKVNMADPSKSFRARQMAEGKVFFGHVLTQDDMLKGVDFLNELANKGGFVGKFFETDIPTVMQKYGQHYADQFGTAEFLGRLVDGGGLQYAKQVSTIAPEWVSANADLVKVTNANLRTAGTELRAKGSELTTEVSKLLDAIRYKTKGVVGLELGTLEKTATKVGSVEDALKSLDAARASFKSKIDNLTTKWIDFKSQFEKQTEVVNSLNDIFNGANNAVTETEQSIAELMTTFQSDISVMNSQLGQNPETIKYLYQGKESTVSEIEKIIDDKIQVAAKELTNAETALAKASEDPNLLNDILTSKLDVTTGTGIDAYDNVLNIVLRQDYRDVGVGLGYAKGGRGGLGEKNVEKFWSAEGLSPEMSALKVRLDPTNSIKPATLSKIFMEDSVDAKGNLIPGIRTRIARATTTGDNLQDLREAGVWLLTRDMKINPDFLKEMIPTHNAYSRYENLVNLIDQAGTAQRIVEGRAAGESTTLVAGRNNRASVAALTSAFKKTSDEVNRVQELLHSTIDVFDSLPENQITNDVIDKYRIERNNLERQFKDLIDRKNRLNNQLPKQSREVANRVVQLNGYKDIVADLGNAVSEYYLHRETSIQLGRVIQTLEPRGQKVNQQMYNRILAGVSASELKTNQEFMTKLSEVKNVFERMRSRILSYKEGDISRSNTLREELSKIFNASIEAERPVNIDSRYGMRVWNKEQKQLVRDAELLREHFPEIEAVWRRGQLGSNNRLFYQYNGGEPAKQLEQDVIAKLKEIGITPEWGKIPSELPRVVKSNMGEVLPRSYIQTGGSVEYQAARYDAMRGNIEKALATLDKVYAEKMTKKLLPNTTEKLTTNFGKEYQAQVGEQVKGVTSELRQRYNEIMAGVEQNRKLAQEATDRAFGVKGVISGRQAVKNAVESGETYGFSSLTHRAINGSNTAIDDLFAELLGGPKLKRGTEYSPTRLRDNKLIRETRGKKEYITIPEEKSYFGKSALRTQSRIDGLRLLAEDPAIATETLVKGTPGSWVDNKWIPGSWVLSKDLRGANAFADALEEHANNLLSSITKDKQFNSAVKVRERDIARLSQKSEDLLAKRGEQVNKYGNTLRTMKARYDKLRAVATDMEHSMVHPRALQLEREQAFSKVLSSFTEDVATKNFGFTPSEWNALWVSEKDLPSLSKLKKLERSARADYEVLNAPSKELYTKLYPRPQTYGYLNKVKEAEYRLQYLQNQIAVHESRTSAWDKFGKLFQEFDQRSNLPNETRKPFEILSSDKRVLVRNQPKELPSVVSKRSEMLMERWKSQPEFKHLQDYRAALGEADNTSYQAYLADKQAIIDRQDALRVEISALRGDSVKNIEEMASFQNRVVDALNEKRKVAVQLPEQPKKLSNKAQKLVERLRTNPESYSGTAEEKKLIQYVSVDQKAVAAKKFSAGETVMNAKLNLEEAQTHLEQLQFDKIIEKNLQDAAIESIANMTDIRKRQLAVRLKLVKVLDKEMGVSKRLAEQGKTFTDKFNAVFESAGNVLNKAETNFSVAKDFESWAPERIVVLKKNIDDLTQIAAKGRLVKGTIKKADDSWMAGVEDYIAEASHLLHGIDVGDQIAPEQSALRTLVTNYLDAKANYLNATVDSTLAQREKAISDGIKALGGEKGLKGVTGAMFGQGLPPEAYKISMAFDDGFVQLSKQFPSIGVKKELSEFVANVHRINEPAVSKELNKFLGAYTRFFKAYATLSPGFHVRNSVSNGFMLFAAGGNPKYLSEGLDISRSWISASRAGDTFEKWLTTMPERQQGRIRTAFEAAASSGGGMTGEFLTESTPFGTGMSKKLGRWIEQNSRFMLAYDGVAQGLDMNLASARVKRFLIDYENTSTMDKTLRQIIPFWMWTSRNLPMQVQNMWLNPRAYQIYASIKRNLSADQPNDVVPAWMRETGAWKLPFGKELYFMPDLGFNRVQQQINELRDPSRFLANVNPALRIPVELAAGKQFYSNRPFSSKPVEATTNTAKLLQPFLQSLGYGQTGPDGKQYVSDRVYSSIRNAIPSLATAERLTPSIDTLQQSGGLNSLASFLGIPGRQLKESDKTSELRRQLAAINQIVSQQKAVGG